MMNMHKQNNFPIKSYKYNYENLGSLFLNDQRWKMGTELL